MTSCRSKKAARGFSLIEVLVTLLIVSFGLLGVSKMQAAALSNTQIARARSLIALQAGSLASAMHGNRGFWAKGLAPDKISIKGATVTDSKGVLTSTADCVAKVCTPAELAAYDVQAWARNMQIRFPGYEANIECTTTVGVPVDCFIELTWAERYVAINRSTASAAGAKQTATQQFSLMVQP